MQFQIEVGETTRTVVVEKVADTATQFRVSVNGRVHIVDARRLSPSTLSLLVANKTIEAAITPERERGAFTIGVNGQAVPVQMRTAGAGRRAKDGSGAAGSGPQKVVAPMPGKVVRVLVQPGDEVKPKQGLVVVEAMKMENELKAVRAGRVRDVLVSEGRSVDAGAVLVIVE